MIIQQEQQLNEVAGEVQALLAVIGPILRGVLYALKREVAIEAGDYENLKLLMLGRLRRQGDGDCGICFEYAVHEALNTGDAHVVERVTDALKLCKVTGDAKSLLFGIEKSGRQQLIDTVHQEFTDDSRVLSGLKGQPPKIKRHLSELARAFRRRTTTLPTSISGLWKADLFLGVPEAERWVGTTVKINANALVGAKGLRVGIVPSLSGRSDRVIKDESKNLIICPLHHDGLFMEIFYDAWNIVLAFFSADSRVPKEVVLPNPAHREVARQLEQRREFPVLDVIEALKVFAQPELLVTAPKKAGLQTLASGDDLANMVVAPLPRRVPVLKRR
ncbi:MULTISPECIES: hypothetical protein [unclassified Bradyrhizobium]|uniref:hypothetical protein n=1 Tax=unclassified Bradyrhizobium TaxID=2631580 RepID=UPI0028E202C0|nr:MULTISPECIES: hypothetical protein [unclassified Bradyrhizobium]